MSSHFDDEREKKGRALFSVVIISFAVLIKKYLLIKLLTAVRMRKINNNFLCFQISVHNEFL